MHIFKIFRLVAGNIILFFFLLFALNFFSFLLLKLNFIEFFIEDKIKYGGLNRHHLMTNGKSIEYNKLVLEEFYQLETIYKPFVVWSRKEFEGKTTTINQEGDRVYRCNDCKHSPSSKTTRFFGGSIVWGTGVGDSGTIPYYYNQINPTEIVHNHGESGFTSRQSLARLINIFNKNKKIDNVIFYEGYNDITEYCRIDVDINSHGRAQQINTFIKEAKDLKSTRKIIKKFLYSIFLVYTNEAILQISGNKYSIVANNNNANEFFNNDENNICCDNTIARKEIANTIVNNWILAKNIVENNGGKFYAILHPTAYNGNSIFHKDFEIYRKDCLPEIYDDICDLIRMKLSDKAWFFDLTNIFDKKGPFYIDACHVSDFGNEIVAKSIHNFINNN